MWLRLRLPLCLQNEQQLNEFDAAVASVIASAAAAGSCVCHTNNTNVITSCSYQYRTSGHSDKSLYCWFYSSFFTMCMIFFFANIQNHYFLGESRMKLCKAIVIVSFINLVKSYFRCLRSRISPFCFSHSNFLLNH